LDDLRATIDAYQSKVKLC